MAVLFCTFLAYGFGSTFLACGFGSTFLAYGFGSVFLACGFCDPRIFIFSLSRFTCDVVPHGAGICGETYVRNIRSRLVQATNQPVCVEISKF